MGYRKCLGCGYTTGNTSSHPACPKSGTAINWEVCDCGSGAHPRRCALHPFGWQQHIDDMNAVVLYMERSQSRRGDNDEHADALEEAALDIRDGEWRRTTSPQRGGSDG